MIDNPLISVDELASMLGTSDSLVVDCRKDLSQSGAGLLAYRQGHIPGAVFAELDSDLSDLSKKNLGRHPLPDAADFSRVLSRWGWHPGMRVVAYDDAGGALAAARLWWMLRLVGERHLQVLDGGFSAWLAAGHATEAHAALRTASDVSVQFDTQQLTGYAELQNGLEDDSILLIDARATPRFRGDLEPLDPVAGHVPNAINRPFSENIGVDGRFKASATLRDEFSRLINGRDPKSVVHMCGSGVTACHNLLAMERAGLNGSRLFAPSWSGWVSDGQRPVATGD
jgi:thiosulfate/3-mercaptopyruvate sulfurtransferase